MTPKILNALLKCPLFYGMSNKDIVRILDKVAWRVVGYDRHDTYCMKGDVCRNADIVVSGTMVARMTGPSGRQAEVIRICEGDIVAPCFIFSSDRRLPVRIETVGQVEVLRMSPALLHDIITDNDIVLKNYIRHLSDTCSYLVSRIGLLTLMTVREKVAFFLRAEAKAQQSLCIKITQTRQSLADSFAIQKFSLLRCMSELVQQGIVSVNGKHITILDIARLR